MQGGQFNSPETSRRLGEILYGALQYRPHAYAVSRGIVMEGHGDLDQSLKKLFVFWRCGAPDVFECLVGVEEFRVVEQANSLQILFGMHTSFWHSTSET